MNKIMDGNLNQYIQLSFLVTEDRKIQLSISSEAEMKVKNLLVYIKKSFVLHSLYAILKERN